MAPDEESAPDMGSFLGLSANALHAIGCLTIAAARLEWTIKLISIDLLIPPENAQATALLKKIKSKANESLPKHSRLSSAAEITDWAQKANSALNKRHVPSHSIAGYLGGNPVLMHIRSGNASIVEVSHLMAAAEEISEVTHQGSVIDFALRYNPYPGVYLPNAIVDSAWAPIYSSEYGSIDKPGLTKTELDKWRRVYNPASLV